MHPVRTDDQYQLLNNALDKGWSISQLTIQKIHTDFMANNKTLSSIGLSLQF